MPAAYYHDVSGGRSEIEKTHEAISRLPLSGFSLFSFIAEHGRVWMTDRGRTGQ